jgi:hypothetical protein
MITHTIKDSKINKEFNEYKKVKRRIQKNIGRKRNHSNALKKLAARKRNRS